MKSTALIAIGMVIACGETPTLGAESLALLLHEAVYNEETIGDLDAAMEIYKRIVALDQTNRSHAARALYRLGICHLKRGNREDAATAWEQLIEQYPLQIAHVDQARKQLAELGYGPDGTIMSSLVVRRVAQNIGEAEGAVSPDGRYYTFSGWGFPKLHVGDVKTGQRRVLTDEWEYVAYPSVFSPDSKLVAFPRKMDGAQLCVILLEGGEPRVVWRARNSPFRFISPYAWSPDGRNIAGTANVDSKTRQIVLVSVDDGSERKLKEFKLPDFPQNLTFSPDGRFLIYHALQGDVESERHDIFVLTVNGNEEIPFVQHPADDQVLGWSPDGGRILLLSDRRGTTDAWLADIVDGRPRGLPRLVKSEFGDAWPWGFTWNSAFYYTKWGPFQYNIYLVPLDPTTGKAAGPPARADFGFVGANRFSDWSHDGKFLAYCSSTRSSQRGQFVTIRNLATGEERRHSTRRVTTLRWSPDGKSLFTQKHLYQTVSKIYQIDVESGDETVVATPGGAYPTPSADGNSIYYVRGKSMWRFDLESGQEHQLHQAEETIRTLALSPDGRRIAFVVGYRQVWVIGVEDDSPPKLLVTLSEHQVPSWYGASSLCWSADGQHVLYGRVERIQVGSNFEVELWRVPVVGGEPESLGLKFDRLRDLRVHPNGHQIAFVSGTMSPQELWVMENFLSAADASN